MDLLIIGFIAGRLVASKQLARLKRSPYGTSWALGLNERGAAAAGRVLLQRSRQHRGRHTGRHRGRHRGHRNYVERNRHFAEFSVLSEIERYPPKGTSQFS